jgi:multidrug efflux pump subunit AcrA (membrane-fusion protein)
MPITHENENGEVITAYTEEERAQALAEAKAEAERAIAEKEAEIERLKKVSAEKTENFKRYNEMTQEEKEAYDANTTNLIKRNDALAEELNQMKTTLTEKEQKEREYSRNSVFEKFHAGDADTKAKIEANYALLAGMPETNPQEIEARAQAAARLAGVATEIPNPIYSSFNGEAPRVPNNTDNFLDTPKGKEAQEVLDKALGINRDNQ